MKGLVQTYRGPVELIPMSGLQMLPIRFETLKYSLVQAINSSSKSKNKDDERKEESIESRTVTCRVPYCRREEEAWY